MKIKIKNYGKGLLAVVLTLAMVLQYWNGISFQAEAAASATGYQEVTYSDWGFLKGAYNSGEGKDLSVLGTTLKSLDGVAFTGYINFGGSGEWVHIGAKNYWEGLQFQGRESGFVIVSAVPGYTDNGKSFAYTKKNLKTDTFKLRLTFDFDTSNNLTLGVWIDDEFQQNLIYNNGIGAEMGAHLLFNGSSFTIADAVREYQEVTYSNWGFVEGQYNSGEGKNLSVSGSTLTSLDRVAFTGYINFGGSGEWVHIGAKNYWEGLQFQGRESGFVIVSAVPGYADNGKSFAYTKKNLKTDTFKLRLTFDFDTSNNLTLGVWIDDEFQQNLIYNNGIGAEMGAHLLFNGSSFTIADAVREQQKVTFSDWGIKDGAYTATESYSLQNGLNSLNGTIFQGNIAKGTGDKIMLGGVSNAWAGIQIYGDGNSLNFLSQISGYEEGSARTISYANKNLSTDSFKLKLTIDYDIDNVVLGVWIDDEFQRYIIYYDMATAFGTKMLMNSAGLVLSDVIEGAAEVELTDVTWADFGVANGTYQEYVTGCFPFFVSTSSSLVNSSFRGKVRFDKEDMTKGTYRITYGSAGAGGWNCLNVIPNADGTLSVIGYNSKYAETFNQVIDPTTKMLGVTDFLGETFELGIDLVESGLDLKVYIYINGVKYNEEGYVWTGAKEYVGTHVNFLMDGCDASDVIIIGEKAATTDIDWETFGLGKYKEFVTGCWPFFGSTTSSLVNSSFRGKVLFDKEDMTKGTYRITYGSVSAGEWNCLNVIPNADGTLSVIGYNTERTETFNKVIDPTTKTLGVTSFLGESFELGIDLVESGSDLKVYIYINGVKYNITGYVWTGAKDYVGTHVNFLMDGCDTTDIIIIGEEQPIEQLPTDFMEITFNDFGIADGTYSGVTHKGLAVNGPINLDKKILSTDIKVEQGKIRLFYGTPNGDYTGLFFDIVPSENRIVLYNGVKYEEYYIFTETTGGFDLSGNNFTNLKITTEYVNDDNGDSKNDVKVGMFINGVLYNNQYVILHNCSMSSYVFIDNYDSNGTNGQLTISNPKRFLPSDYEQMTFSSVGMSNVEKKNQGGVSLEEEQTDWNGLIFSGKAILSEDCEIRFDSFAGWEGVQFEIVNNILVFNDAIGRFNGNLATWTSVNAGDLFSFSIATKYIDLDGEGADDLKLGLWVNGEMYGNRWFYILNYKRDVDTKTVSYNMFSDGSSDAVWCSLYSYFPSTESGSYDNGKYYYNVKEGGYLLSTSGGIEVNGVVKSNGDVLQTPGDYNVVRTEGNTEYNTTVVIWSYGDAHPDGKMSAADLVAIKKAVKNVSLATDSGLKGADITKDGNVNNADITLVREVLVGKTTLDDSYTSTALSYATGDSKVMPIGGFWGPYGSLLTDNVFTKIKDSGINLITYSTDTYGVGDETNNVLKQLELAEKHGISMFVRDNNLTNETYTSVDLAQKLASYSMYQSFKGFTGLDEPSASDGTYGQGTTGYLNWQNKLASSVNAYANLTHFINMYPLDSNYGDATAYKKYLDEYCRTYNPKMLSYDDYLFNSTSTTVSNCGDYFENLAIVRQKAIDNNIPFWTFVQSGVWKGTSAWLSPSMTEGEMKWNANIALAFGAKGIQYFPVINPSEKDTSANWLASGLLDASGNETEWYGYAKKINAQIAAVDDILMNSTNEGVMLNGRYAEKNIKDCGIAVLSSYKEVTGITSNDTSTIEYGAVAGCFDYQGKTALYVVNYNTNGTNNVTLTFSKSCKTQKITSAGVSEATGNTLNVNLAAGEAALIVID